jgi:hypothetical protein
METRLMIKASTDKKTIQIDPTDAKASLRGNPTHCFTEEFLADCYTHGIDGGCYKALAVEADTNNKNAHSTISFNATHPCKVRFRSVYTSGEKTKCSYATRDGGCFIFNMNPGEGGDGIAGDMKELEVGETNACKFKWICVGKGLITARNPVKVHIQVGVTQDGHGEEWLGTASNPSVLEPNGALHKPWVLYREVRDRKAKDPLAFLNSRDFDQRGKTHTGIEADSNQCSDKRRRSQLSDYQSDGPERLAKRLSPTPVLADRLPDLRVFLTPEMKAALQQKYDALKAAMEQAQIDPFGLAAVLRANAEFLAALPDDMIARGGDAGELAPMLSKCREIEIWVQQQLELGVQAAGGGLVQPLHSEGVEDKDANGNPGNHPIVVSRRTVHNVDERRRARVGYWKSRASGATLAPPTQQEHAVPAPTRGGR